MRKKIRAKCLKNLTSDRGEQALTGIRERMPGYSLSPVNLQACMELNMSSYFVPFKACGQSEVGVPI
jgi:hypothetical protein